MGRYISRSMLALLLAATASIAASGAPEQGGGDLTIGEPHRMPRQYSPAQVERRANAPESELDNVPGPAGADHWWAMQRQFPFPSLDINAQERAAQVQAAAIRGIGVQAAWQGLGPANIGGRVTDLVVAPESRPTPSSPAAASGGVWRSTDAGATFSLRVGPDADPVDRRARDHQHRRALRRHRRVQPGRRQRHLPRQRASSARPTTARSWTALGPDREPTASAGIAIDPTNPNRMFVAATGNLFVPGGQRGLYRTTDGGATWQLVLAGANGTTGAIDVAIDPNDPNRIYVAMWDHQRMPNGRVYGGVGSGIYRSHRRRHHLDAAGRRAARGERQPGPDGHRGRHEQPEPALRHRGRRHPVTSSASGPPPTAATPGRGSPTPRSCRPRSRRSAGGSAGSGSTRRRPSTSSWPGCRCWSRSTPAPAGGATPPRSTSTSTRWRGTRGWPAGSTSATTAASTARRPTARSPARWTKSTSPDQPAVLHRRGVRAGHLADQRRPAGQRFAALLGRHQLELDRRRRRPGQPDRPDQPEQGLRLLAVRRLQPLDQRRRHGMTAFGVDHLGPAQLADAGRVRPEQPGDHVLRRQPAQPLHQLRRSPGP